ncbi:hypothetical protein WKI68_07000 [Streptomyces sp. MS1.HAVA.3]|uniref:Integral membrane protein n=1 Tax=Streptomyces caledonius TaxID=3134107 RepID=A0ABU8U1T0_9ACTN
MSSATPSTAYEPLTWRQSPALHFGLLGAGAGVLLLAAIAFPATALVRRLRGAPTHPRAARAARTTAVVAGLIAAALAAALAAVVADGNAMMEAVPLGSPLLTTVTVLGAALVPLTLGVVAGAIAAWLRGWWNITGRILFTVTAAGAVAMASMLLQYRLVGAPFDWLTW